MYFSSLATIFVSLSLTTVGSAVAKDPYVRVELVPDEATVKTVCTKEFKQALTSQFSSWVSEGAAIQFGESNQVLEGEIPFKMTYDRDEPGRKRGLRKSSKQQQEDDESRTPERQLECAIEGACNKCCAEKDLCYAYCGICGDLCGDSVAASHGNLTSVRSRILREEERKRAKQELLTSARRLTTHCTIPGACDTCCQNTQACKDHCGACNLCGYVVNGGGGNSTASPAGRRDLLEAVDIHDDEITFEAGVSAWAQYAARRWIVDNDKTGCMGNPSKLNAFVTFKGV